MGKNSEKLHPLIIGILLALGVAGGYFIQQAIADKQPMLTASSGGYNKIDDILNYLDYNYVDEVKKKDLSDKAIVEMLKDLDPHTNYIPASDLRGVNENMSGSFEGIGVEFYIVEDTITVVSPISGGPSEIVGIRSGDQIVTINDSIVAGTSITNSGVVKLLRGKKGTKVSVGIKRNGGKELLDFEITRDKIPLYSIDVSYMMDETIGYIRMNRFSGTTYDEFMQGLAKLDGSGMEKLIIDLRQNPGGYLQAATMILDELIGGKDLLVYTEGRAYPRTEYKAKRQGRFENGELVILIDEGSASASEIVAGAVQDLDRGAIIGRRSFGKGLVQEQYALRDSSAIRVTIARYYTPSGRSIQKPYDEGRDDYNQELFDRYESGELYSADSLVVSDSLRFFTKSGKTVYGGGGIFPDVFVSADTSDMSDYFTAISRKGLMPEFIYDYFSDHSDDFGNYDVQSFRNDYLISSSMMTDFVEFTKTNNVDFDQKDFDTSKDLIELRLKAFLGKQLYSSDGFYPILIEDDITVQEAYQYLKGGKFSAEN